LNFQDSEIPKNEPMFKDPGAFVYYDKDINRKKWDSEESEKNNQAFKKKKLLEEENE
jgi:hypothetical protein